MKKKLLSLLLATALVFSATACGGGSSNTSSEQSTEADDSSESEGETAASNINKDTSTLYVNMASEPAYLDPALNSAVDGAALCVLAFAGILTYDENDELVPELAEAMPEVSKDGKTYTVKLKESKWSNGDPVTANDFVYSWNRACAKETAADYAYLFDLFARKGDKLDVEAKDDLTLVMKLNAPCPYFTQLLAFPCFLPVHQKSVEEADPDGKNPGKWAQEAGFVCNGPFTLTEWKHEESMTYEKNPNYIYADRVKLEKISNMLSADNTATYAAYNKGDLDFIDQVPNEETATAMKNSEFVIAPSMGTYYASFSLNGKIFDGMTAEQASAFRNGVSRLIDRQYIVDQVGQTGQIVADAFIPEGMSDGNGGTYDSSYYDASAPDLEGAKQYFEDAGMQVDDNGDGTYKVTKGGETISLSYILNEDTGHKKVAECIQQDLAAVGIEMTVETLDWNVLQEQRKKGDYIMTREGWLADYDDPINMLEIFTSDSGNNNPQLGKSKVSSAPDWSGFDKLISDIRSETDNGKRSEMLHEAEDMLMETGCVIPIYYYNNIYMLKPNVKGMYVNKFGTNYFAFCEKTAE